MLNCARAASVARVDVNSRDNQAGTPFNAIPFGTRMSLYYAGARRDPGIGTTMGTPLQAPHNAET